jgi:hypothetical protein
MGQRDEPQPRSGDLFVAQYMKNDHKPRSGDLYGIRQMDTEKKKFPADLRRWYRRQTQREDGFEVISQMGRINPQGDCSGKKKESARLY